MRKEQFYRESCIWGGWLGVSADVLPPDYPAFCSYLQTWRNTGQLAVGVAGREICESIFRPEYSLVPNIALAPVKFLTIGMLQNHYAPHSVSIGLIGRKNASAGLFPFSLVVAIHAGTDAVIADGCWKIRRETR